MPRLLPVALLALLLLTPALQAQQAEALIAAIEDGDVEQVRALLEAGADANARVAHDDYVAIPLVDALVLVRESAARLEIVDLLLRHGADPKVVYGDEWKLTTPLIEAVSLEFILHEEGLEGQGEVTNRLLEAGADPSVTSCEIRMWDGRHSIAGLASGFGLDHILVMLARAGAEDVVEDPELRVLAAHEVALRRHDAPLHAALVEGAVEAVERLLAEGHDPSQILEGRTFLNGEVERFGPLDSAVRFSQRIWPRQDENTGASMVRLLLAAGADPDELIEYPCESRSEPVLAAAIATGQSDVVRALLEAGADPDLPARTGEVRIPPLVTAAREGQVEIVRLLLTAGADPDAVNTSGHEPTTAWQAASARLGLLEEFRGQNHALTAMGMDAVDAHDYVEIAELLREAGAVPPFTDAFAACEAGAAMSSGIPDFAAVRFEILGPEAGRCRVSLTYTSNPNPDWVDRPLTILLDPAESFTGQAQQAFEECSAGDAERYDCQGPLLETFRH